MCCLFSELRNYVHKQLYTFDNGSEVEMFIAFTFRIAGQQLESCSKHERVATLLRTALCKSQAKYRSLI
jgi:hypothetical protein